MVTPDLVVVDGPNLYNRVAEVIARFPKTAKGPDVGVYFSDWFDIDRLLQAALRPEQWPPVQGIHLVHSERALGRQESRLKDVRGFWTRQACWPGCRDRVVHFPMEDVDEVEVVCTCGKPTRAKVKREKGVDATVITIFYENLMKWESGVLAANDTDFAPVVESLHRLGKTMSIVGRRSEQGAALERLGHEFIEIPVRWLERDLDIFRRLRAGGELDLLFDALDHTGLDAATRIVSDYEHHAFGNHHDYEVIIGREDHDAPKVEALVAERLPGDWIEAQTRHRMTVLTLTMPFGNKDCVERYCTGARWMRDATSAFPARFLRPDE